MDSIQRIKEKYGQSTENIIAEGLNMEKRGKKYRCPNHYVHRNNDRDPSMSWDPEALQFFCFGCGMQIDLYGYYRDHLNYTHGEVVRELLNEGVNDVKKTSMQKNRDTFSQKAKNVIDLTDDCMDYIELRGISKSTANHFKLGSLNGQIAFPYYKYSQVVGYKLRKPMVDPGTPKMTNVTGSKPYLFNAQNIDLDNKELIICEGEFDSMIIHQSGYPNVVSVGAGANSLKALLEQAESFLENFERIILVSDNDRAGNEMDKEMVELLGDKVKLIDKKLYTQNDINDEHFKNGEEKVRQIIDSARFKIEGRRDLEQDPYRGITEEQGRYVPTGIKSIDYALNDLAPKRTTLIAGRSSSGKSTFVNQLIANAIDKGNKTYLMNGESDPEVLLNRLYQAVIGRNEKHYEWKRVNKRKVKEPTDYVLKKLKSWHRQKLFLFNKGESELKTTGQLLQMLETEIKFNQYDLIVIDNLMSILSVSASEKYEQQADFMQSLCDLARLYNTHIVLVLHPNKSYSKDGDMEMEHISGSSDLYNKADNIISVTREYDQEIIDTGVNGELAVLKNRVFGDLVKVETHFDEETRLLLEVDGEDVLAYTFGIDRHINGIQEGFTSVLAKDCPF